MSHIGRMQHPGRLSKRPQVTTRYSFCGADIHYLIRMLYGVEIVSVYIIIHTVN